MIELSILLKDQASVMDLQKKIIKLKQENETLRIQNATLEAERKASWGGFLDAQSTYGVCSEAECLVDQRLEKTVWNVQGGVSEMNSCNNQRLDSKLYNFCINL